MGGEKSFRDGGRDGRGEEGEPVLLGYLLWPPQVSEWTPPVSHGLWPCLCPVLSTHGASTPSQDLVLLGFSLPVFPKLSSGLRPRLTHLAPTDWPLCILGASHHGSSLSCPISDCWNHSHTSRYHREGSSSQATPPKRGSIRTSFVVYQIVTIYIIKIFELPGSTIS